jgi:1,4-alpha-glucan branching enzyme
VENLPDKFELLPLNKLGAREDKQTSGKINFGLFLPGVSEEGEYELFVRVIHEKDQFLQDIPPMDFEMEHSMDLDYGDYWSATIDIEVKDKLKPYSAWGTPGKYVYRYCLKSPKKQEFIDWIIDPFAREFGVGKLSAFTLGYEHYVWNKNELEWKIPFINDIVLYELMVSEFADDIKGTIAHLDYLADLGINCIELMPLSNVEKRVDWGFAPIGYFGVDDRFGNRKDMQELIDKAHQKGIAVIVDSVYAHTSHLFPYYYVYSELGFPQDENPFMGPFAENWDDMDPRLNTDFNHKFTRDFFLTVNNHWLDYYHVDGFRYDYVPGYWLKDSENGYTKLVLDTYHWVKAKKGSSDHWQRFFEEESVNLIQCAEYLPCPTEVLEKTYSNCTWQNRTLDAAKVTATNPGKLTDLGCLFGLFGYPAEVQNNGDKLTKTALQYLETHDHSRFICNFGTVASDNELFKEGDRTRWYRLQPYLIGLLMAKGIPMLWQGQEFGENYWLPQGGWGRVLLYRPVRWEYFYTTEGRSLVNLVRKLVKLRRNNPQFTRGEHYFYNDYTLYQSRNIMLFSRTYNGVFSLVALNFGAQEQVVNFKFPFNGNYREELHGQDNLKGVSAGKDVQLNIPGNYGRIWTLET